ncbi:hypothetical protein ACLB2K_011069 [Fragaria x ananassa]
MSSSVTACRVYVTSLESFINEVAVGKVSLVVQGYFAPAAVKYASIHQEKIDNIILLNPPKYVEEMRTILTDENWKVPTTICWGKRDRWLTYDGVEDFCKDSKHKLIEIPMAGHHVQEDCGEELGQIIYDIIRKRRFGL